MPGGLERRRFVAAASTLSVLALLQGCAAREEEAGLQDPALESASILQLEKRLAGRLGVYAINAANGVSVAYREQDRFALEPGQILQAFDPERARAAMPSSSDESAMTTPRALLETLLHRLPAAKAGPGDAGWSQRLRVHGKPHRVLAGLVPADWSVIEHAIRQSGATCMAALVLPPGKPVAGVVVMTDTQATKNRSAIVAAAARQSFRMLGLA